MEKGYLNNQLNEHAEIQKNAQSRAKKVIRKEAKR